MKDNSEGSPRNDAVVSYKQLGLLVLVFVLGVTSALLLGNIQAGTPTTFSTTELIGFMLSIILTGASIILAVAAITLGKSSEQAVIKRSDESIRLQNEVFVRTTEALQRIEASTGVTEKRIEDIISGRVGDLSHRIAELATKGGGGLGKSVKELEEEIRESIMQSVKDEGGKPSVEKMREKRQIRLEERKREEEYQSNHQKLLNAFANRDDLKEIKSGHGSINKAGDDLFDGIFSGENVRVGVSTFSNDANSEWFKIYASNVAVELLSGNATHVYVVFFDGCNKQSQIEIMNTVKSHLKEEIGMKIHILTVDPDKAEKVIGELKISNKPI